MFEVFWSVVGCILKTINFVLDVWVSITRLQRFLKYDAMPAIKVPPDPKILTPAAKRALAERRHRDDDECL